MSDNKNYKEKKIYIAGHRGMVGSAIQRCLEKNNYKDLIFRTSSELNLIRQADVENFFKSEKPNVVIVAAAKVGGILANSKYRADFIYDNIMIESNIIHYAHETGVEKLIFLGSSCIYPKLAPQPIKEEYLLTDSLEFTNEPYAIAKISGIKLCESYYRQYNDNYFSAMPTNLYGQNDNFNFETSHVLPALIRKFHEAKTNGHSDVTIWGTGTPKREFLYVDDLAEAIVYLLENTEAKDIYDNGISQINIGSGVDLTIGELAQLVADVVGFKGKIVYDNSKPDGTPRKLMDVSRINNLGWKYKTSLKEGIEKTYAWFNSHKVEKL
jgi:GDP-L-fucose synthase